MTWKIAFFTLLTLCLAVALKRFYYQTRVMTNDAGPAWKARADLFARLPLAPGTLVFAGDSHIEYSPFAEIFGGVNRGIGAEQLHSLLKRLPGYIASKPRGIVVLSGINDISQGRKDIEKDFDSLFSACRNEKLYLLQIMPIGTGRAQAARINAEVDSINSYLEVRTRDQGIPFIATLNKMEDSLTWDGLHLNAAGYKIVTRAIANAVGMPPSFSYFIN